MLPNDQSPEGFLTGPHYSSFVAGPLQEVLVGAALCALLISMLLLWLYLRAVKRSMRRVAGELAPRATSAEPSEANSAPTPPQPLHVEMGSSVVPMGNAARTLADQALAGPWKNAGVYALAGLVFSSAIAGLNIILSGATFSLSLFLYMIFACSWPILLSVGIVVSASWSVWITTFIVFYLAQVFALVAMISIYTDLSDSFFLRILAANLFGTTLALFFLARWIRAVGPITFAFLLVLFLSVALTINSFDGSSMGDDLKVTEWLSTLGQSLGLKDRQAYAAATLSSILASALLAWVLSRRLGALYTQGWLSDQSLVVDSILLMSAAQHGMVFAAAAGSIWFLGGLGAFLLYKASTIVAFAQICRHQKVKRLLDCFCSAFSHSGATAEHYSTHSPNRGGTSAAFG